MCLTKLFFIQLPCEENTSECMLKNVELLKFLSELKLIPMLKKINEKIRDHFCIIAYNKENSTRLHLFQREIESITRHSEINELIPEFVNNLTRPAPGRPAGRAFRSSPRSSPTCACAPWEGS